ncbi:MAG: hypothetical protein ACI8TQ_003270 [Planctomycetota bacterium]|jgi:hypothetical protein
MSTAIGACERCNSPVEQGDLRCAICGVVVPVSQSKREVLAIEVMRCDDCGAVTEYDVDHQAPHCAFCDATMHLERIEDPVEQAELTLPFKVTSAEASSTVKHWLGTLGWFRPGDLKTKAQVEGVRPLMWVGWCFDAEALVSWTADSNAGSRRSAWAPHSGQVLLRFDDIVVSASRGLSEAEAGFVAETYDLASATSESETPEEVTNEQFDVQRSQARELVSNAIRGVARSRIDKEHVPGTHTRKVSVEPLIRELVTRRYRFPAWVMAYRYEGKVYRAVVSGQDATAVLGKAPYSVARIAVAVLGSLAFIALIILAIVVS